MIRQRSIQNDGKLRRKAAAMIEFAVCLPVFLLITIGTTEVCRMIYLRQSLKIIAFECARLGIVPGVTLEDLQDQCDVMMLGRKLKDYQMHCSTDDLDTLTYGDTLTITVDVKSASNSLIGSWFYTNAIFTESVTIMAEH